MKNASEPQLMRYCILIYCTDIHETTWVVLNIPFVMNRQYSLQNSNTIKTNGSGGKRITPYEVFHCMIHFCFRQFTHSPSPCSKGKKLIKCNRIIYVEKGVTY